ncbi:hypothetical protein QYF36_002508 [Acer negundo]|nr:hypothetical protein QYF36_002508 [Acer negundo]
MNLVGEFPNLESGLVGTESSKNRFFFLKKSNIKGQKGSTNWKLDSTIIAVDLTSTPCFLQRSVRAFNSSSRSDCMRSARTYSSLAETKLSLASFLGELALNNDVKVIVAKTVGSSLINIMKNGNIQAREAALKALNQISSCEASAKVLIEAGILPPLVKDLFTVGSSQLPMRLKEVSATILASIVSSGYEFDSIAVGPDHQTLVLVGLIDSPTTVLNMVTAIKSSGTTIGLVQFVKAPRKDLHVASIKLLQNLSPHMGEELADELLKVKVENIGITEEQAAAVGLLADLPERDVGLTRQMLDDGAFQLIFSRVVSIQKGETRGSRFVERILQTDDIAYEVSGDPNVSTALADAFQHADYRTRQIDKIPNFSGIFPNIG